MRADKDNLYAIAGADISEMAPKTFSECYSSDFLSNWPEIFSSFRKPVIAAVNGFAVRPPYLIKALICSAALSHISRDGHLV